MTFGDKWRFVRQNMKKNRVRVFMTILAAAMGSCFLIVLASVGFGLHDSIVEDQLESSVITKIEIYGKNDTDQNGFTSENIAELQQIDGVETVREIQYLGETSYHIDGYTNEMPDSIAVDFEKEKQTGLELESGKLPEAENEIIVSSDFAKQLVQDDIEEKDLYAEEGVVKTEYQYQQNLLNKEIELQAFATPEDATEPKATAETVKIVGIEAAPANEYAYRNSVKTTPALKRKLDDALQMTNSHTEQGDPLYSEVEVYASNAESVDGILTSLEEKEYQAYSNLEELKNINVLFNVAKAGLIIVGTIAVLIASIGIYNTMTMAVTERAPDIGIMKAIGANPKTIKQIFLMESTFIGLAGAWIGTAAAYIISFFVNTGVPIILEQIFEEEIPETMQLSSIPFLLVAISVLICLIVTILSGARPAKQATNVDVIRALRREI
ncbi:ABC transporter permease [Terribacillus sp. DMT04]|uniref:ABC transporter permease n=1 Tax=Terribacillus sp. DMT04 TaxID=2850441 RepID=UPI001C2BE970|nr:FtsX-like permease family protein [Terribacillus sp. DMT04]QXE02211.1 FtsX-like permease family protein [Terribacillus sp. DMT04]